MEVRILLPQHSFFEVPPPGGIFLHLTTKQKLIYGKKTGNVLILSPQILRIYETFARDLSIKKFRVAKDFFGFFYFFRK